MYDLLAEGKKMMLYKVPAHIAIKGNEEAHRAANHSRYSRNNHNKTTLYRLLLDNQDG